MPLEGENIWPAMPNQFPFIASIRLRNPVSPNLLMNSGHYCSGSLITSKHVLTAAHCLERYAKDQIFISIGEEDLSNTGFVYEVESWITYVEWIRELNRSTEYLVNDIAIIKVNHSTLEYVVSTRYFFFSRSITFIFS